MTGFGYAYGTAIQSQRVEYGFRRTDADRSSAADETVRTVSCKHVTEKREGSTSGKRTKQNQRREFGGNADFFENGGERQVHRTREEVLLRRALRQERAKHEEASAQLRLRRV